ncbi:VOC family protein [Alteromonas sp. ASW11-130]|uniref:VOC family protein n=1 Tax=Alteromonas sp. ASW11-130 TaxID=3015775 RepID=UPI002241D308|nr:VOC family protein [Alteromonas sp. ASW11-130]MCW8093409.1 VOC family protein [Alteromonas sp. ASW11-130]
MAKNMSINYLEMPSRDLQKTKAFFGNVFNWSFTDYGEEYVAFTASEIEGGFYLNDQVSLRSNGASLIVFYTTDLEQTQSIVERANGKINEPIFNFPGGRRFHFIEPGGSEFAMWSDK